MFLGEAVSSSVTGAEFGAALEDAGEPAWAGATIVFLSGPRFAAAGAGVWPWERPTTRTPHDNPVIRPAC